MDLSQAKLLRDSAVRPEAYRQCWQQHVMSDPRLSAGEKNVLIAISWYWNAKRGDAWPGIATLAADTCTSRWTAIRAEKLGEKHGYMRVTRRRGRSNRYELLGAPTLLGSSTRATRVVAPTLPEPPNKTSYRTSRKEEKIWSGEEERGATASATIFVPKGTLQWDAWSIAWREKNRRPGPPEREEHVGGEIRRGWWFPAEWPMAVEFDAISRDVGRAYNRDQYKAEFKDAVRMLGEYAKG
jgi:hypothetical protein